MTLTDFPLALKLTQNFENTNFTCDMQWPILTGVYFLFHVQDEDVSAEDMEMNMDVEMEVEEPEPPIPVPPPSQFVTRVSVVYSGTPV